MKREVVWAPEALRDLASQLSYIAADSKEAARIVRGRIYATVDLLSARPIGRLGRVAGTYEKSVLRTRYIIAYELPDDRRLHILRMIHSSRDWPKGEWPEN